jgi:hypothetical protein
MSTWNRQWSAVAVRPPRSSALQLAILLAALTALALLAGAAVAHQSGASAVTSLSARSVNGHCYGC